MQQKDDPLMSSKEARKLLGKKANNMTNEDLKRLIIDSGSVIRVILQKYLRSNNLNK